VRAAACTAEEAEASVWVVVAWAVEEAGACGLVSEKRNQPNTEMDWFQRSETSPIQHNNYIGADARPGNLPKA